MSGLLSTFLSRNIENPKSHSQPFVQCAQTKMLYSEGVFGQIIFLFSWVRKKEGPFEKYDAIRKTCNSMDDSIKIC